MSNKIALITGASRGLGRASALELAKAGTHIIGTYKSSKDEATHVADQIEALGVKAAMLPMDAESQDFKGFADRVSETLQEVFGAEKLDHIVNNAGIGIHANFPDTTADQLDQLYRIHLRTPFLLTQALLPHLNDGGSVLFVSSGLARFTLPGYAAYAAMKGAVEVLTRYAAKELGGRGIRVNCIAPGAIATDFGGGAVRDDADVNGYVASMTALGRVGEAEDIGGAVAAILSDAMRWTNGTCIEVSGGQSL
jgi:NAD(P)-dependent dehydrogenase (short-subunit alcohol dehydrogenase family)